MATAPIKPLRIVISLVPSRALMQGIARYVRPDHPWLFELAPLSETLLESLVREPPDGAILYVGNASSAQTAQRIPVPVVNISGALAHSPLPRVCTDSLAAGRLAAEHFLERGFGQFGFVGYTQPAFSQERHAGFVQRLAQQGKSCQAYWTSVALSYEIRQRSPGVDRQLQAWLEQLPVPAAIFAANDSLAWWTLEVAALAGRHIPNELAVLGMDDAEFSTLSWPQLSSVLPPFEQIGYESAALLDKLMRRQQAGASPVDLRLAPTRIITRQSTDILAVADPHLRRAVRFIHEQATDPALDVRAVARAAAVDRRNLERLFRRRLQRSPLDEIHRVRVERAKVLLGRPELSIERIAEACGFGNRKSLTATFRALTGLTPVAYRKR